MSKRSNSTPWSTLIAVAVAAVISVPVVTFFLLFRFYLIPTGAMEKTLLVGDHLIARIRGIGEIQRGQIVVFQSPSNPRTILVKRVEGVPGDRLKIVKKQLYLNGVPFQESYIQHMTTFVDPYRDGFPAEPDTMIYPGAQDMLQHHVINGEVIVPPGKYFVMGDNRDLSLDSRYFGFVDRRAIFGRPLFVYMSLDSSEGSTKLRGDRFFKRIE